MDLLSKEDIKEAFAVYKKVAPERVSIEPVYKVLSSPDEMTEPLPLCKKGDAIYLTSFGVCGHDSGQISELIFLLDGKRVQKYPTNVYISFASGGFADSFMLDVGYGVEMSFSFCGYRLSVM